MSKNIFNATATSVVSFSVIIPKLFAAVSHFIQHTGQTGRKFTLIGDVKAWFVLWIVTVEEEAGLVGGAEERLGDDWTAEPVDDGARLQRSTADL